MLISLVLLKWFIKWHSHVQTVTISTCLKKAKSGKRPCQTAKKTLTGSFALITSLMFQSPSYHHFQLENKQHNLMIVLFNSNHQKSHVTMAQRWLQLFNPSSPDMKIHILLTVVNAFLMKLLTRISLNIKTSHPWWSFPLFSSQECFNKQSWSIEKFHFHHC